MCVERENPDILFALNMENSMNKAVVCEDSLSEMCAVCCLARGIWRIKMVAGPQELCKAEKAEGG